MKTQSNTNRPARGQRSSIQIACIAALMATGLHASPTAYGLAPQRRTGPTQTNVNNFLDAMKKVQLKEKDKNIATKLTDEIAEVKKKGGLSSAQTALLDKVAQNIYGKADLYAQALLNASFTIPRLKENGELSAAKIVQELLDLSTKNPKGARAILNAPGAYKTAQSLNFELKKYGKNKTGSTVRTAVKQKTKPTPRTGPTQTNVNNFLDAMKKVKMTAGKAREIGNNWIKAIQQTLDDNAMGLSTLQQELLTTVKEVTPKHKDLMARILVHAAFKKSDLKTGNYVDLLKVANMLLELAERNPKGAAAILRAQDISLEQGLQSLSYEIDKYRPPQKQVQPNKRAAGRRMQRNKTD
jgi:hypothetical protein